MTINIILHVYFLHPIPVKIHEQNKKRSFFLQTAWYVFFWVVLNLELNTLLVEPHLRIVPTSKSGISVSVYRDLLEIFSPPGGHLGGEHPKMQLLRLCFQCLIFCAFSLVVYGESPRAGVFFQTPKWKKQTFKAPKNQMMVGSMDMGK